MFVYEVGGFGFKCQHSHCHERKWKEFRVKVNEGRPWFSFPFGDDYPTVTVGKSGNESSKNRLRMSHADLIAEAKTTNALPELVENLIVRKTVNLAVGDSGLGKTPLFLQMCICIAFGLPFLEQDVQRGRVLIVDYENYTTLIKTLNDLAEFFADTYATR